MAADDKLDLLPGTLEMLILKTLASASAPQHGYQILRRIHQTSDEKLLVEEGSLYPALHRMEKRGWVEAEWGQSELNRRARFYELTGAGRQRLSERTAEWKSLAKAISSVLGLPPSITRGI